MNTIKLSKPRIFHLLSVSLPKLSGYSIRSHNILKHQMEYFQVFALTEPNYIRKKSTDIIENVTYFRIPHPKGYQLFFNPLVKKILKKFWIFNWYYRIVSRNTIFFLKKLFKMYSPDILHVHSSHFYGYYIGKIAKKMKIPFVFEVRGFVEDTHVGLGILKQNSLKYNNRKKFRLKIIQKADVVVTLGQSLRRDLISQGVKKKKIKIVPNAVDTKELHPKQPKESLKAKLGISKDFIIGYIGSIRRIEGIETLIKALSIIKQEIKYLQLLLIGPGDPVYINELNNIAKKLKVYDSIKFLGPISNSEIDDYYSILDICIIPRLNIRVNQLVTPLKPLEVMAMGKALVVSDLPALKELVKSDISGVLFKAENPEDLANKIIHLISNPNQMEKLGKSSRQYVKKKFDWSLNVKKYIDIYETLLNKT